MGALSSRRRRREPDPSLPYVVSPEGESREELQFKSIHSDPVLGLCVATPSSIVSSSTNTWIYVYDWMQHSLLNEFVMPEKAATKVVYNSSSQWLHGGGRCGKICSWKWPIESSVIVVPPATIISKHTLAVTGLACSDFHSHLLVSGSRDNSVHIWDVETQRSLRHQEISRNLVTDMAWLGGGERGGDSSCVVQSSEDKTLRVWDINTCSVAQQTPSKQHIQLCCAASDSGQYILSGSGGQGHGEGAELTLWDRRAFGRTPLMEFTGHKGGVNGCLFLSQELSNDKLIASCSSDSTIKIWDSSTGKCVSSEYIGGAGPVSCIVSPSPEILASSTFNDGVHIWKLVSEPAGVKLRVRAKY